MADVKLSKIEEISLGTAILWSWANVVYSNTSNPNETYLMASSLIVAPMALEPIGKAIYQIMRRNLKTE